jgi:hypothetical protein
MYRANQAHAHAAPLAGFSAKTRFPLFTPWKDSDIEWVNSGAPPFEFSANYGDSLNNSALLSSSWSRAIASS